MTADNLSPEEVIRYDFVLFNEGGGEIRATKDGDYVHFEDYDSKSRRIAEMEAELKKFASGEICEKCSLEAAGLSPPPKGYRCACGAVLTAPNAAHFCNQPIAVAPLNNCSHADLLTECAKFIENYGRHDTREGFSLHARIVDALAASPPAAPTKVDIGFDGTTTVSSDQLIKTVSRRFRETAAAPATPVAGLDLHPDKVVALYHAINQVMACIGAHGSIDRRDDRVEAVMDWLHAIDGGNYNERVAVETRDSHE